MDFIHIADVHLGASPDAGFPWNAQRTTVPYTHLTLPPKA